MQNPGAKVVIVEGLIAIGKTTLSTELGSALGPTTLTLLEPDEQENANPFLDRYYADPTRWGFTMQVHLLTLRFGMHLAAQWHVMLGRGHAVLDRSYFGDTCFARMLARSGRMNTDEFRSYQKLYHEMTASVLLPHVCIRVLGSPEVAAERIARRSEVREGRRCERAVDLDYLRALDEEIGYMTAVLARQGVAVFDVPWDADRETPEQRAATVQGLARRIEALRPPDFFLDLHRRTV